MARKIRVTGRDAALVGLVGVLAAVGAILAGPSPTGSTVLDVLLVGGGTIGVVWAAASSPWWAGVAAAAVGTAFAPTVAVLLVGAAAVVAGLASGLTRRTVPWTRAVVAGLAVQVLARLGDVGAFGVSSAIAIVVLLALAVLGLARRPRRDRRIALWAAVGAAVFAALATAGGAASALGARGDVEAGVDRAQDGVDLLAEGEFDAAQEAFADAARLLGDADRTLNRPWAQPARIVPVLAHYRSAGTELVGTAADVAAQVADALAQVDVDALRVRNGAIDIAAVQALDEPLQQMLDALDELVVSARSVDSDWLPQRVLDRLERLADKVEAKRPNGDRLMEVIRQAPSMLGAEGPRRYFIAFTTPSEVRGLGGFMGNWAEVTLDGGRIQVTGFGRHTDLYLREGTLTIRGPEDFLEMWGYKGFQRGRANIWADVTMSPHFPSVAQVIAELYPQSGGAELDGVVVMDVYTIAALMQITGGVDVPEAGVEVTPENAAEFMLHDQYLLLEDKPTRVDALEVVAQTTITRLLTSELPSPPDFAELLAPYLSERRMVGWSRHADEQAMLSLLGYDGALPDPTADGDYIALALNNAGNNKIDYYLDVWTDYDLTVADDGRAEGTLTIDLTNNAPRGGEPAYVLGNAWGLAEGTNYLYLSAYGKMPVVSVTVNGLEVPFRASREAGYHTGSVFVALSGGRSRQVVVRFAGEVRTTGDAPSVTWLGPPTVRPVTATLAVGGDAPAEATVSRAGVSSVGGG